LRSATASAMAISGKDFYIAGADQCVSVPFGSLAVYWKDGQEVFLTDSTVYVAGHGLDHGSGTFYGLYWKNGAPVYLTEQGVSSNITLLAVSRNVLYLGGDLSKDMLYNYNTFTDVKATCWKNNAPVALSLTGDAVSSYVEALVVVGN
jgi:hypothetical protein